MYDIHNNLAPDDITNMFTKLSSVNSYRTISVTNENYHVEQVRTESMKRAFSITITITITLLYHIQDISNKKKQITKIIYIQLYI